MSLEENNKYKEEENLLNKLKGILYYIRYKENKNITSIN
jgi:hypothetical protein